MLKKILVVDTETIGLPIMKVLKSGARIFHSPNNVKYYNPSRMIQLSFHSIDMVKNDRRLYNLLIKPDGFKVGGTEIHKITQKDVDENGLCIKEVLNVFKKELLNTDLLVMHNVNFDKNILMSESYRYDKELYEMLKNIKYYCTMRNTKNICKLPSQYYNGYKNPKLVELHNVLFPNEILSEDDKRFHDAKFDMEITTKCFLNLYKNNYVKN